MSRRFAVLPVIVLALALLALPASAAAKPPQSGGGKGCGKKAADSGTCAAREKVFVESMDADSRLGIESVVRFANEYPGGVEIGFAPGIRGEIVLNKPLAISGDITIVGPGADALRISAAGKGRIFEVSAAAKLEISGLTLTGGRDVGKAGKGFHEAGGPGIAGGMLNRGAVVLEKVTLANNVAVGGPAQGGPGGPGIGGAIVNYGTLTLRGAKVSGNSAVGSGQHDPQYFSNEKTGGEAQGGAILNEGAFSVDSSEFLGNVAHGGAGERIVAIGVAVSNAGSAYGGAIYSGPKADSLRISDSTFADNRAEGGYVPEGAKLGDAGGGAIYGAGPGLALTRSTVTGNAVAVDPGRGTAPRPFGAGLALLRAGELLRSDTIAFNKGAADLDSVQPTPVVNSILGGCSGALSSRGFNLDYGTSCNLGSATDISGTDARLTGLEDHGGATRSLLPFPDSPVIDRGVSNENQDQRGQKRPVVFPALPRPAGGDGTDIGSVELQTLDFATVTPPVLDFGDQRLETISKPLEVVITDVAAAGFHVGAVKIAGEAEDDYSISSQTCASSDLAPSGTCRIRVRFSPTDTGSRNAVLHIDSTARGGIPPVPLTGRGVEPKATAHDGDGGADRDKKR